MILVHQVRGKGFENSGTGWCRIRFNAGVKNLKVTDDSEYYMGTVDVALIRKTYSDNRAAAGVASVICIPTATSVQISIRDAQDDDIIYVYRAG